MSSRDINVGGNSSHNFRKPTRLVTFGNPEEPLGVAVDFHFKYGILPSAIDFANNPLVLGVRKIKPGNGCRMSEHPLPFRF